MSWQQDQSYGGYSNYGNYGETQYGGESATLDMFDDVQAETGMDKFFRSPRRIN